MQSDPHHRSTRRRAARLAWRLARETSGVVYIEALSVIPVFVIAWACSISFHDFYAQSIALAARDRGCAWIYASQGCRQAPLGNCAGISLVMGAPLDDNSLPPVAQQILRQFESLPGVRGIVDMIFGRNARSQMNSLVPRSKILGGQSQPINSKRTVACNPGPPPMEPQQIAALMWCLLSRLC